MEKELTKEQYKKAYKIGYEYLTNVAEQNDWKHKEIFEESESQGEGYKYGLTLVGYEDDERTQELGIISIDLANISKLK